MHADARGDHAPHARPPRNETRTRSFYVPVVKASLLHFTKDHGQTGTDRAREHKEDPAAHKSSHGRLHIGYNTDFPSRQLLLVVLPRWSADDGSLFSADAKGRPTARQ